MPRGRKPKAGVAEAEGTPTTMKELIDVMERKQTRYKEEEKEREEKRSEEHRELMRVLTGLVKRKKKTKRTRRRASRRSDMEDDGDGEEDDSSSSSEAAESESEGVKEARKVGGREPVLAKFCEKEMDTEHFLTGFERIATAYMWPDERWVLRLAPLLTGKALAAYANMDAKAARSYQNVKKAILRRFDINEETYRQKFRSTRKTGSQSYVELGVQLMDLFRKWTVSAKDIESMTEMIVMEQLLKQHADGRASMGETEEAEVSGGCRDTGRRLCPCSTGSKEDGEEMSRMRGARTFSTRLPERRWKEESGGSQCSS